MKKVLISAHFIKIAEEHEILKGVSLPWKQQPPFDINAFLTHQLHQVSAAIAKPLSG